MKKQVSTWWFVGVAAISLGLGMATNSAAPWPDIFVLALGLGSINLVVNIVKKSKVKPEE